MGYEVEGGGNEEEIERELGKGGKIMYLLEGGLRELDETKKEG